MSKKEFNNWLNTVADKTTISTGYNIFHVGNISIMYGNNCIRLYENGIKKIEYPDEKKLRLKIKNYIK